MKVLDVLTSPWAIVPEKLLEIQNIYATHLRGDKIDLKAVEARIGADLKHKRIPYENRGGVGIVTIEGVLARHMNLMMQISGGTSTDLALRDFEQALGDQRAESILILMDSPGGTVDGTQDLAEAIYGARGQKPMVTLATGMMTSAAYWIGAAADRLLISSDNTIVGSIGVVATHVDVSRHEEMLGLKTTEITAGKYKRIASQFGPLSQEGRASMQEMVDQIYTAFVHDVAAYRGRTVDAVLSEMADGRLFLGHAALAVGLVDGFATEQDTVRRLQRGELAGIGKRAAGSAGRKQEGATMDKQEIVKNLTAEDLKTLNPALAEELFNQGRVAGLAEGLPNDNAKAHADGYAKGLDEGKRQGAEAERARIKDVEAQSLPGHASLIEQLKYDGKTTGPEAAVKILQVEKEARVIHRDKLREDALAPMPQPVVEGTEQAGNPGGPSGGDKAKERDRLIAAHQAEHKCDYRTAAFAVSKARPELFKDR